MKPFFYSDLVIRNSKQSGWLLFVPGYPSWILSYIRRLLSK